MLLPKHIDLHMHSTCSDGTDEPLELLEKDLQKEEIQFLY